MNAFDSISAGIGRGSKKIVEHKYGEEYGNAYG